MLIHCLTRREKGKWRFWAFVAAPTEFVVFDLEHTAWSPGTPRAVRHLRNVSDEQNFVDLLSRTGLGHSVICATGFFSDTFDVLGKPCRVRHVPVWLVKSLVPVLRLVGGQ